MRFAINVSRKPHPRPSPSHLTPAPLFLTPHPPAPLLKERGDNLNVLVYRCRNQLVIVVAMVLKVLKGDIEAATNQLAIVIVQTATVVQV